MKRVESFDYLKGLALFFVVLIHAKPFVGMQGYFHELGIALVNLARFAVPCFFLISGYIFSRKLEEEKPVEYTLSYLKSTINSYWKATVLFLSLNVFLFGLNQYLSIESLERAIRLDIFGFEGFLNLLYFGDAVGYHLWFLPALILSIATVYLFNQYSSVLYLLFISFLAHMMGVASGAYNVLPFPAEPRDPLFFGLFFVTTGFYISENNLEQYTSGKKAFFAFLIFASLHIFEGLFISSKFLAVDVASLDYSFFTAPMSISLFLLILSKKKLGNRSRFSMYGRESLWIYIIHPIIVFGIIVIPILSGRLLDISFQENLLWQTVKTPLVFILSAELVVRYESI